MFYQTYYVLEIWLYFSIAAQALHCVFPGGLTPGVLFSGKILHHMWVLRTYIAAEALPGFPPRSTGREKCNLAFTSLQLLCATKWLTPFVKLLSTWPNKCPFLTVCLWSKGYILCETLNQSLTQYCTDESSLWFFWQVRAMLTGDRCCRNGQELVRAKSACLTCDVIGILTHKNLWLFHQRIWQ